MSKGMNQKKDTKKKPAKSMKEKRAEKQAKRQTKGWRARRGFDAQVATASVESDRTIRSTGSPPRVVLSIAPPADW